MPALGTAQYAGVYIACPPQALLLESKRRQIEPVMSSGSNTRDRFPQTFSYSHRRFAFADKCIRSGRQGGLVTRIQVAN